ncbi:MAG: hypothetical protein IJX76_04940 [Clostridia bacterium]|nr:hypothetical protein [Clostridia bacterium]
MKRDEIKAIFPDATDDQITRTLNLYGTSVGDLRTQLGTATADLEALRGKGDIDAIIKDRDDWKTKAEGYEADARNKAEEAELSKRFASAHGGKKFVNSYTEQGLLGEFKAEIAKPENQGKADADIYSALTKDRTDLYLNERQNPNVPGAGAVMPPKDADAYIADKYKDNPFFKG